MRVSALRGMATEDEHISPGRRCPYDPIRTPRGVHIDANFGLKVIQDSLFYHSRMPLGFENL